MLRAFRQLLHNISQYDPLLRKHCCSQCFHGEQTSGKQNKCFASLSRKPRNIWGNIILLQTQNVSEKIQKHFLRLGRKFVSATNVACVRKQGNICIRNSVSATMFARLRGMFLLWPKTIRESSRSRPVKIGIIQFYCFSQFVRYQKRTVLFVIILVIDENVNHSVIILLCQLSELQVLHSFRLFG